MKNGLLILKSDFETLEKIVSHADAKAIVGLPD